VNNPRTPEHIRREKLHKIEALFTSAAQAGDQAAAFASTDKFAVAKPIILMRLRISDHYLI
jgi:hypothetical protein